MNLLIIFILLVLYGSGLLKERSFYVYITMLPLDLFVFSWQFHEVVSWGYSNKTKQDYRIYIGDSPALCILMLLVVFFGMSPMVYDWQCICGENNMYRTAAALSVFFVFGDFIHDSKAEG